MDTMTKVANGANAANAANGGKKGGGLDGVVVSDTRLSDVDGERGRLVIAGHDVESLSGAVTFEQVLGALSAQDGAIPTLAEIEARRRSLGECRARAFARIDALGGALSMKDGMDALRAAVAQLPGAGENQEDEVIGAVAVFAAAWSRVQAGHAPIAPDETRTHAADYLRMVMDGEPHAADVAALDAYLVAVVDHGMNASTFAARVVTSTGSDVVSSVVAAIGALKGPLHGGAPGPVLDMLDAIAKSATSATGTNDSGKTGDLDELAVRWLETELLAGRRIMGMGHRIYRVRDPRAAVLERAASVLWRAGRGREGGRLALARAVERAATSILRAKHPQRPLHANVEFFTAILLDALGLPRGLFSPTFAVGRVGGWTAHVLEQRAEGRLIRPASRYVGAMPSRRED